MALTILARACATLAGPLSRADPKYDVADLASPSDYCTRALSIHLQCEFVELVLAFVEEDFADYCIEERFQCTVLLPLAFSLPVSSFVGKPKQSKKPCRASAAAVACKALHAYGKLDDHLLPVLFSLEDEDTEDPLALEPPLKGPY